MKKIAVILIFFIAAFSANGQLYISTIVDIGSNNMSQGAFGRPAGLASYRHRNFKAQFGMQAHIASINFSGPADRSYFSAMYTDVSRDFKIREFPFKVSLFMMQSQYSDLINEWDFGLAGAYKRKHLEIHFGLHSRIYALERKDKYENAGPEVDLRIYEYRNFMYKGIVWLHEVSTFRAPNLDYAWNVGVSLTNFDQFHIQQETNPMLTALFQYEPERDFILFSEFWYQGAGMLNLAANYYGFYFKAGFTWQIKL